MSQLISYEYNDEIIEFDVSPDSLMVNATEMAKIFDKKVEAFTRNNNTQEFINAFIKSENSRFLSDEKNANRRFFRRRFNHFHPKIRHVDAPGISPQVCRLVITRI